MRSLRRVLCLASVAGIWVGCSVNETGLTDAGLRVDVGAGAGGNAGAAVAGRGGAGGAAGTGVAGHGGGIGGAGSGGGAGSNVGAGGSTAGSVGSGGALGAAGTGGSGNAIGSAGAGGSSGSAGTTGGDNGTGGGAGTTGGSGGTGGGAGVTGGSGGNGNAGAIGSGGNAGNGNAGATGGGGSAGNGNAGATGGGGRGGRGGGGGRGGTGGNPCTGYPSAARSFVTPTDGRVHCYWARSSAQTWSEASQSCMLQNGHLVTILSAEENAFVVSMAQFSTSFSDTWIGATDGKSGSDRTGAGTYRWVTNEPWGFTSWGPGEPDGFCDPCSGGQSCTCDHRATLVEDGTWTDRWADNSRSSVCEATPD